MPYEKQPPVLPAVDLTAGPLKTSIEDIEDAAALEVVTQSFWQFELYRTQNHDRRWSMHDSLVFGYVAPKVWDGTNVARAAFTQPIVFDQIETALPTITNAIFGVAPDWFQVAALPGTDPKEAEQVQDALSYQLEHPKDEVGSNCISELKLAIRNLLTYGNGGVSVQWDAILGRPTVEWVDLRDFYIDPALSTPDVDEGRATIRRKFMTIDELIQLRKDPRMKIPENDVLWYMAKNFPQAPADQTKRIQEALRNVMYSPGTSDYLPLPSDQKIEVLIYYSKSRIIWVLNRQWVAYNGPNPYGFIPFCFAPCYTVTGRFYAQSIADVQENNQRYVEALLNGHLDEMSLALHPPRTQKRSTLLTPNQQKWRPGAVFSADNKDDISLLQNRTQLTDVFTDIQYILAASDKRTGISGMAGGGVPTPSNANRTLGGLQMQSGGTNMRISELVSNIELYLLTPVLYKLHKLMQFHMTPGQAMPATDPQKNYYSVDASVIQKKVRFRMLAASKMVTRDKLMQVLPFWMQTLSQGNIMEGLKQTGKTIDFDELFRMIQDATGVSNTYALVRPLNEQEQKAAQQPSPQMQADQQKQQADLQGRMQLMQLKNQGEVQKAQVMKQPDPWAAQIAQQKAQQDAAAKQQEMQADQQMQQAQLEAKRQELAIKLGAKKQEHQMDLQKQGADLQATLAGAQQDRQISQVAHEQKMAQLLQSLQADQAQAQNQQSIADKFPASQQQPGGSPAKPDVNRPLTKHGVSKPKAKPPQ